MRIHTLVGLAAAATLFGASLVPASAARTMPAGVHGPAFQHGLIPQIMTRAQVKAWRASVLPKIVQEHAFKYMATHHPVLPAKRDGGSVKEFIMDDGGYIWAGKEKKSAFVISSYMTDCSGAEGGRVDQHGNLVVACTNTSSVNIYNAGNVTGPADTVLNDTSGYYPADAFVDGAGNHYATNLYGFSCTTYYCYFYPGNIVEWYAGDATGSLPDQVITDPNMYEAYFGDIDASGNIYVDGFNNSFIPNVDMLHSGVWSTLPITLNFPGGVYVVSPRTANPELSVLDQGCYGCGNDALYLYTLPAMSPVATLNPPQNLTLTCDPVAGGYDKKEKHIKIGDAGCRAGDYGVLATNSWTQALNVNFSVPIDAAFVKSDK
jgi:hypothetical protein